LPPFLKVVVSRPLLAGEPSGGEIQAGIGTNRLSFMYLPPPKVLYAAGLEGGVPG